MKDLKQLTQNFKPVVYQKPDDIIIDDFAKNIINKVFDQLSVIFPAWKYNWQSDDPSQPDKVLKAAKMEWTKAFNENSINTMEQIKHGFIAARRANSDFLPSCGKFISWCKPSPESLGYPPINEAMKQCIKHRANQSMFSPQNIYIRPMIIELCKRVDWWMINHADNAKSRKEADDHFKEMYHELISSDYTEPKATDDLRLPTQETVKAGMSDEQKADKQKRDLESIRAIKAKFKGVNT